MLHDLDKTLENMLVEHGKLDRNEIDLSFEQPNGEWSAQINRPTINCWCFDLRENTKLRNMDIRHNLQGMDKSRLKSADRNAALLRNVEWSNCPPATCCARPRPRGPKWGSGLPPSWTGANL